MATTVLGPPIVLPFVVAQQHAFEALEAVVPAGFPRRFGNELPRRDAPFFALQRVIDGAQTLHDPPIPVPHRLRERLQLHLLVQGAEGHMAIEQVFVVVLVRRI